MRDEGRHAEALSLLQELFAEAERESRPGRPRFFMTMFQWALLAGVYAPARTALEEVRQAQVAQLLAGDLHCGAGASASHEGDVPRTARFSLIVEMNRILRDAQSTTDLFVQLDTRHPELARRYARHALPALVETGDFALADRYRTNPLALLDEVSDIARRLPLFPTNGKAPRPAGELIDLTMDVRIGMAVLRGLGHEAASDALGLAMLVGLESSEVRGLAQRELDGPGTINREIVAHKMAQED